MRATLDHPRRIGSEIPGRREPRSRHLPVGPGHGSGLHVEHIVVFAALSRRDDRQPEHARPRNEADKQARLVAVDERVWHTRRPSPSGEDRPDHALDFLADHGDAAAGLDRGESEARARLGVAGGLDDDLDRQRQKVVDRAADRDRIGGERPLCRLPVAALDGVKSSRAQQALDARDIPVGHRPDSEPFHAARLRDERHAELAAADQRGNDGPRVHRREQGLELHAASTSEARLREARIDRRRGGWSRCSGASKKTCHSEERAR